jgi:oligoribonuclease NrnB/cAMP/cGMP phosphodiesterase (DHH superfamily)
MQIQLPHSPSQDRPALETPLVLYHAKCNDGLTAAWAVRLRYPGAEFRAVDYGQKPPEDVAGRDIVIVDFSYPAEVLLNWLTGSLGPAVKSLTVLDHHKTAEAALRDLKHPNLVCIFDMERSGASIAWDYFVGGARNWLISLVEATDLWKFERFPNSKELIEGLRALPMTFATLDELALHHPATKRHQDGILAAGRAALHHKMEMVKAVAAYAYEIDLFGHKVLVANCPHVLNSEVGHELAKGRAFGVTYYEQADRQLKLSFRSNDGFDTTTISKRLGGGGHSAASGATVAKLPWAETLLA